MRYSVWICPALALLLVGCVFVPPDGKDPAAVVAYNNQLFQLYTQVGTAIATLLGILGLWVKSNVDKRDLANTTKAAAEHVAAKTEETKKEVIAKVEENTEVSRTAFVEANGTNEKILALQRQVSEIPKRAPSRSTDPKKEAP